MTCQQLYRHSFLHLSDYQHIRTGKACHWQLDVLYTASELVSTPQQGEQSRKGRTLNIEEQLKPNDEERKKVLKKPLISIIPMKIYNCSAEIMQRWMAHKPNNIDIAQKKKNIIA